MTIAEWLARGKEQGREAVRAISPQKRFTGALVAATALAFGFGVIASQDWHFGPVGEAAAGALDLGTPVAHAATTAPEAPPQAPKPAPGAPAATGQGSYVASKSGTKFYLPTCSGAKRIKDENKVWFDTEAAAEAAGYEPAANCKGL